MKSCEPLICISLLFLLFKTLIFHLYWTRPTVHYLIILMSSSNCYSSLYPFPFDLNEDDQHQQQNLFALKSQPSSSSSSCSLTCPTFFNPSVQNQAGSKREPHEFQDQQDQAKICVPQDRQLGSGGDHHHEDSSYKWMPSKMRILRKMMSSERSDLSKSSTETKIEDLKVQINHPSSSPDNSSNPSYNNNNTTNCPIRVCSDCNTTKTPLWRSGPRGPKSLCNACGIRQRKARRAMAAAAAAAASNGTDVQAETTTGTKSKVQNKAKRSSNNCVAKLNNSKKYRLNSQSQGRKKLCFEDLRVILSKNSSFHRVFPQDEKEAAILLMALSYGLVHG